jgi:transposase
MPGWSAWFAQLLPAAVRDGVGCSSRRVVALLAHAHGSPERRPTNMLLDARLLARCAERVRPPHHQATDEQRASLRDLLVRREQVIQMRTAEINRLTAAAPNLRPGIQQHIDWLDQEIRALEQGRDNEAERTDECAGNGSCAKACPASARSPHGTCCSACPNWGPSIARKRRPVVGVAPYANQSGAQHKPRHISGGRRDVRSVLYMATLAATRRRLTGAPSISACVKLASRARSPSSLRCASC